MKAGEDVHDIPGDDPLVGKMVDRYQVLSLVARGGMGRVYRARQANLDRIVALKTMDVKSNAKEAEDFRARFEMEASICSRLTHPNTVRIYDHGAVAASESGTDGDLCWMAMEFLEGRSLKQAIQAEAPMPPLKALHLIRQVCGSLAEAHAQNLVHRDLKPSNIILVNQGADGEFPKVVDFGLVKPLDVDTELTTTGVLLGSPLYMSPEQVQNLAVDARADIYSLGTVLYEMLCGDTPFDRSHAVTLMMAHVSERPPTLHERNPDVNLPESVEWLVQACLAKKPKDRFASVNELSRAIKLIERELAGAVPPLRLVLERGIVKLPDGVEEPTLTGVHRPPELPTTPDNTLVTQRPGRSMVAPLIGLGAVGLLVLALVSVVLLTHTDTPSAPVEAPAPAPEVAPVVHEVIVSSEPDAAQVEREGVFLGDAPVKLHLKDGERATLDLSLPGFETRRVTVDGSQATVSVVLSREITPSMLPQPAPAAPKPTSGPKPHVTAPKPAPAPVPDAWDDTKTTDDVRDPWGNPAPSGGQ